MTKTTRKTQEGEGSFPTPSDLPTASCATTRTFPHRTGAHLPPAQPYDVNERAMLNFPEVVETV
jgi:hypothetical protein